MTTEYPPRTPVWVIDPDTDKKQPGTVVSVAGDEYQVALGWFLGAGQLVISVRREWLERREYDEQQETRA